MKDFVSFAMILGLWTATVAVGFYPLLSYDRKPAPQREASARFPSTADLPLENQLTLVMFIHPKCACSRASLYQLKKLNALSNGKLKCYLVFEPISRSAKDCQKSELMSIAKSIPGATVLIDHSQKYASVFSAAGSGEVFCYTGEGSLMFHGGLTSARGHESDSAGMPAILSLLRTNTESKLLLSSSSQSTEQTGIHISTTCPSFGCSLFNKELQ